MTTAKNVMKMIKDNDVKYVDFRFTDPRGKWQHVTFDVGLIDADTFVEGVMFAILMGNIFAPLFDEIVIRTRMRRYAHGS